MKPTEAHKKLKALREEGHEVRVYHTRRPLYPEMPAELVPHPRGGLTVVQIDGIFKGVAHCSDQDNYCKRTGLAIALGRALNGNQGQQ